MMEMLQETDYVTHHIQKVAGFFAAMRAFKDWLREEGHQIVYYKIDSEQNQQDLSKNIKAYLKENEFDKLEYQLPDEYRLDQQLKDLRNELNIETEAFDTEHFLTQRNDVAEFFKGKKQYLMENFYRMMRKKHDIMMEVMSRKVVSGTTMKKIAKSTKVKYLFPKHILIKLMYPT